VQMVFCLYRRRKLFKRNLQNSKRVYLLLNHLRRFR